MTITLHAFYLVLLPHFNTSYSYIFSSLPQCLLHHPLLYLIVLTFPHCSSKSEQLHSSMQNNPAFLHRQKLLVPFFFTYPNCTTWLVVLSSIFFSKYCLPQSNRINMVKVFRAFKQCHFSTLDTNNVLSVSHDEGRLWLATGT